MSDDYTTKNAIAIEARSSFVFIIIFFSCHYWEMWNRSYMKNANNAHLVVLGDSGDANVDSIRFDYSQL